MAEMLSMEAWGDSGENGVGEDEVLSKCLKNHIKQLVQCLSLLPALLYSTGLVAVGGSTVSAFCQRGQSIMQENQLVCD